MLSTTDNSFLGWLEETAGLEENTRDEKERYLANGTPGIIGKISAREWWLSPTQRAQFPLLSLMAIDLSSILAMSSEAERVFLLIKKTINQGRLSLIPDTVEAFESLKSWFRAGFFTQQELHVIFEHQEETEHLGLEEIELE